MTTAFKKIFTNILISSFGVLLESFIISDAFMNREIYKAILIGSFGFFTLLLNQYDIMSMRSNNEQ